MTALGLAAVAALILANGYFVAAEFAFVAVRRGRLEEHAEQGDRRARRAIEVSRRLSFVLSGAQLGITVTSLLVGFIAEPTLGRALTPLVTAAGAPAEAAPGIAFTLGFALATAAQMIFGELAPKNLAIARPEAFSLVLAGSMAFYTRLAAPVIRLFDSSANALLRRLGIEPVEELAAAVSPEELEHIIEQSGRQGTLTTEQAGLLGRALEFRTLRAADAMVSRPHIVAIDADATCEELRRLAVESGHSRFPVVGEDLDDVVGVVQAKDVFRVPPDRRGHTTVRALASPSLNVPESALLSPLLAGLRARRTPLAVVVDEYGGTAGIVTLEDIVEELVGEIQDEYDRAEPEVRPAGEGWLVPGGWRLDEVARDTGLDLPPGPYETVGGLVMERLGRLPRQGDRVRAGDVDIVVEELEGLAVGRVRLERAEDDGGGSV